jgi:ABC-type polar amino acid transport system ATPase subunit
MSPTYTASPFFGKTVGVTVSHLNKQYGRNVVLTDVSFEVKPGEIFCIMGPSGSGKSVLLKQIAGLETPTSGEVHLGEFPASDPATRNRVRLALVFQAGALFNSLSVYDNLALYPREHRLGDEAKIRERVQHALAILSLEGAERKFPSELSGGMKKRVSIARALVMEPQLLLYDEPTSELDRDVGHAHGNHRHPARADGGDEHRGDARPRPRLQHRRPHGLPDGRPRARRGPGRGFQERVRPEDRQLSQSGHRPEESAFQTNGAQP